MSYDVNKLTKLAALKALAQKMAAELAKVEAAIPTNVSQLTNDSGYQTSAQVTQADSDCDLQDWPRIVPEGRCCA